MVIEKSPEAFRTISEASEILSLPSHVLRFWESKFKANVKRDKEIQKKIKNIGWQSVVIWECEVKNKSFLTKKFFRKLVMTNSAKLTKINKTLNSS